MGYIEYENVSFLDNLAFPFEIRNKKFDMHRIEELFSSFEMDMSFIDKENVNLSGGEKQRIALIRTLIFSPDVLLLDIFYGNRVWYSGNTWCTHICRSHKV